MWHNLLSVYQYPVETIKQTIVMLWDWDQKPLNSHQIVICNALRQIRLISLTKGIVWDLKMFPCKSILIKPLWADNKKSRGCYLSLDLKVASILIILFLNVSRETGFVLELSIWQVINWCCYWKEVPHPFIFLVLLEVSLQCIQFAPLTPLMLFVYIIFF